MDRSLKITIVDDNATKDPFYPELFERLRHDLSREPTVSSLDSELLLPLGFFDPKRALDEIRRTEPDLILMDLVLHESSGHPDLTLSDWLSTAIRRDASLGAVLVVYVSNYFGDHYPIPREWRSWSFGKQALLTDVEAWTLFITALEGPAAMTARQKGLLSLPKTLLHAQRRELEPRI